MNPTTLSVKRVACTAALWALVIATPAFGHAHLSKSTPAAGGTVSPPAEIVLNFTEPLEPAFSTIELRDSMGKRIETTKAQVKDDVMRLPLKPLPAGRYTVNWRVLSVDTHKSQGNFAFTVKP
jgi:methionine-rich copper-binding protein CopC